MKRLQSEQTALDAIEEIKGRDIEVFDTSPITSLFDRMIIVSAGSNVHARAIAKNVFNKLRVDNGSEVKMEGASVGEWVLIDSGETIVHIMQPAIREYYRLEEIWGQYPIDYSAKPTPTNRLTKTGAIKNAEKPTTRRKKNVE